MRTDTAAAGSVGPVVGFLVISSVASDGVCAGGGEGVAVGSTLARPPRGLCRGLCSSPGGDPSTLPITGGRLWVGASGRWLTTFSLPVVSRTIATTRPATTSSAQTTMAIRAPRIAS